MTQSSPALAPQSQSDDALRASSRIEYPAAGPFVGDKSPLPDCMSPVGWDQNQPLPGYLAGEGDNAVCIPFTPTLQFPPAGYVGDFYGEEFTDAKIKAMWRAAREQPELRARIEADFHIFQIPHQYRTTGVVDARGLIDPHATVDLRDIRRPAFFGADPWREPIAALDDRATVVDVTVPREAHERLHLGLSDPVRLRGWHFRGDGFSDGRGGRVHPLMIMVSGRSVETTAISHPDDPIRVYDPATQRWDPRAYPAAGGRTEVWAARPWRHYLCQMVEAGFDVLTLDKRGHGISGGANDSNIGEQANDLFRALDQLETGDGLRLLTAEGALLAGTDAAGRLIRGMTARTMPVILCGPSQGAMNAAWAMHKNVVEDCSYDLPEVTRRPPRGYDFRGAILLAPFSAGVGYRSRVQAIVEGANRVEFNVQAFPSSEMLANVDRWPAVFVGRGLWDFAEGLEGSLDFYRRARGLKEIVVVRGPHSECEWGEENTRHMIARMIAFARAAVLGEAESPGAVHPADLRDLVCSSPDAWEETSRPRSALPA